MHYLGSHRGKKGDEGSQIRSYMGKEISDDFIAKSIDLSALGVDDIALQKDDALDLIEYFKNNLIPILGGDVLEKNETTYQYNYDNWAFPFSGALTNEESIRESCQKAFEYISTYPKKNCIFSIVIGKISEPAK